MRSRAAGTGVLAVAVVAAVANANFLLAGPLGSPLDLGRDVISDLSAAGQPGAGWFRLGDAVAGLGSAVLAVPLLRSAVRARRLRAAALLAFGVGTLVSALVPVSASALLHDGVSVAGTAGALGGVVVLAWCHRERLPRPHALLTLLAAALTVATGVWEVLTFAAGGNGGGGNAQRVQVCALSAWLVLEAVDVVRAGARQDDGRKRAANTRP
ncbi:DUF998 domain-containing protein [Kineococcus sp. R8]|uniref:DUF998 domain-containing protein n=1 Tax=Kineococcus siccus TaxID=2696567 RepID=UPI0014121BAD|nr:DUF998 domain-containing protein [Kineococcus siccus]